MVVAAGEELYVWPSLWAWNTQILVLDKQVSGEYACPRDSVHRSCLSFSHCTPKATTTNLCLLLLPVIWSQAAQDQPSSPKQSGPWPVLGWNCSPQGQTAWGQTFYHAKDLLGNNPPAPVTGMSVWLGS